MIIQAFTQPGDQVIVQPPVYFPFFFTVERNGRQVVHNRLLEKRGRYFIDFLDLEEKMKAGAKMLILCNPHNPVGRCWSREELEWIGAKSLEYKVLIVSDEIHCDLVMEPGRHIPFATLSDDISKNTITCIAPSKTFNLAGLFTSSIIISDATLRKAFKAHEDKLHLSPNIFGISAAEASYRDGDEWLGELMGYLGENYRFVTGYISRQMPEITVSPLEATYLVWMDFRKWKLPPDELKKRLIHEAGLGFVDGREFGPGGEGFQRMNIGCPRSTIEEAMERLFSMRKSLDAF
jgi:cystathionine beta-lyase